MLHFRRMARCFSDVEQWAAGGSSHAQLDSSQSFEASNRDQAPVRGTDFAFVTIVTSYHDRVAPNRRRRHFYECQLTVLHLLPRTAPLVACMLSFGLLVAESAAVEVTVTLATGRSFTGEIDARSDAEHLRLRFGTAATVITRPIAWRTITAARSAGAAISLVQLRELAVTAQAAAEPPPLVRPAPSKQTAGVPVPPLVAMPDAGGLRLWRVPGAEASPPAGEAIVRSIDIDVRLANWDADVEADGLLLTIAALDALGNVAAVDGTLEVELIGEALPPYTRGDAFPVLGRWSRVVHADDPASRGGYHREQLAFQAMDPAYQLDAPRYALVNARLVVPGQGTFEASLDGLSLRGFTPVRDRLEAASGARLLPSEKSGRGKPYSSRSLQ